ncbi:MAG: hypothetical protein Q7S33_02760 [Nanoarchaeota archaeon]|nr:hypothetical protein [Nanoarchaeota archaeon]
MATKSNIEYIVKNSDELKTLEPEIDKLLKKYSIACSGIISVSSCFNINPDEISVSIHLKPKNDGFSKIISVTNAYENPQGKLVISSQEDLVFLIDSTMYHIFYQNNNKK